MAYYSRGRDFFDEKVVNSVEKGEKKETSLGTKGGGKAIWAGVSGALAGLVNGLFGGGGGMILVPLLVGPCRLSQREGFANSVLIILPLCALSSAIYFFRGSLDVILALPYLVGGLVGGLLGGKLFKGLNMDWLRRVFALFILYGGVKSLL